MDNCKCGKTGCDLEEDYCRWTGTPEYIEEYDYNFFDELVLGLETQRLIIILKHEGRGFIILEDVMMIRKLEDEIVESLK
jgi:hypothetical protein